MNRPRNTDVALVQGTDVLDSRRLLDGPGSTTLSMIGSGQGWNLIQIVKRDLGEFSMIRILIAGRDGLEEWPVPPGFRDVRVASEGNTLVAVRELKRRSLIEIFTR